MWLYGQASTSSLVKRSLLSVLVILLHSQLPYILPSFPILLCATRTVVALTHCAFVFLHPLLHSLVTLCYPLPKPMQTALVRYVVTLYVIIVASLLDIGRVGLLPLSHTMYLDLVRMYRLLSGCDPQTYVCDTWVQLTMSCAGNQQVGSTP